MAGLLRSVLVALGTLATLWGTALVFARPLDLAPSSFDTTGTSAEPEFRAPRSDGDPSDPPDAALVPGHVTSEQVLRDGGEALGLLLFAVGILVVGLSLPRRHPPESRPTVPR